MEQPMSFITRSRLNIILLFLAVFIAISTLDRATLFFKAFDQLQPGIIDIFKIFGMGLIFDFSTSIYFLIPFIIILLLIPEKIYLSIPGKILSLTLLLISVFILGFTAVSEYLFWDEFSTRFNFIAVDYLVYTTEVIGNIKESYSLNIILPAIAGASILLVALLRKSLMTIINKTGNLKPRLQLLFLLLVLPFINFIVIDSADALVSENRYTNELASNGVYSFFAAFRNNELDYKHYYKTQDIQSVKKELSELLPITIESDDDTTDTIKIKQSINTDKPELKKNVVLVVIESMSSEFLGSFGNTKGLTPNMDQIANEGILFTNMQATGTRTVRGLEAISLSVPPTPGRSIVKRPENTHFYNIGDEFRQRGYDTRFIYGGYGYFDNMNAFFANNGFDIVDRTDMNEDEVQFYNTWGVSDEDLFDRVISEADKSTSGGKQFLSIVMTTSNHRPYTYPEGRIDIPSHTGRDGAVKYTDYAIGRFLTMAKQHDWYKDTVFVFIADHCASSAGRRDLAVEKYHIPMIIFAPDFIAAKKINTLTSQIDVAPTLLGLLNFSYESQFFGQDVLNNAAPLQRALIGNYQKLGYLSDDILTILSPHKKTEQHRIDISSGKYLASVTDNKKISEAIAYYQGASTLYEQQTSEQK